MVGVAVIVCRAQRGELFTLCSQQSYYFVFFPIRSIAPAIRTGMIAKKIDPFSPQISNTTASTIEITANTTAIR